MPRGSGRPSATSRLSAARRQSGSSLGGGASVGYRPGVDVSPSYGAPTGHSGRPRPYQPGQLNSAYVAAFRPSPRRKPWGVIVAVVLTAALIGGGVVWGVISGAFWGVPYAVSGLILGTTEAFAYPYGDNNENAWAAMDEAGVLCAFTVENRRVEPGDAPEALPRVRIAGEYAQGGFEYLVEPNGGEQ